MISPSRVATPQLVRALIDDPATDAVTRAALEDRLQVMTGPPSDPFRGLPMPPSDEQDRW